MPSLIATCCCLWDHEDDAQSKGCDVHAGIDYDEDAPRDCENKSYLGGAVARKVTARV